MHKVFRSDFCIKLRELRAELAKGSLHCADAS